MQILVRCYRFPMPTVLPTQYHTHGTDRISSPASSEGHPDLVGAVAGAPEAPSLAKSPHPPRWSVLEGIHDAQQVAAGRESYLPYPSLRIQLVPYSVHHPEILPGLRRASNPQTVDAGAEVAEYVDEVSVMDAVIAPGVHVVAAAAGAAGSTATCSYAALSAATVEVEEVVDPIPGTVADKCTATLEQVWKRNRKGWTGGAELDRIGFAGALGEWAIVRKQFADGAVESKFGDW